mgnify:CR=1 FL=1
MIIVFDCPHCGKQAELSDWDITAIFSSLKSSAIKDGLKVRKVDEVKADAKSKKTG